MLIYNGMPPSVVPSPPLSNGRLSASPRPPCIPFRFAKRQRAESVSQESKKDHRAHTTGRVSAHISTVPWRTPPVLLLLLPSGEGVCPPCIRPANVDQDAVDIHSGKDARPEGDSRGNVLGQKVPRQRQPSPTKREETEELACRHGRDNPPSVRNGRRETRISTDKETK